MAVYWLPAGRYRPRSILSQGLIDDCFRYLYAAIDEVLQHCEEARINTNGKSTKATVLVDGACISWTQYSNFEGISHNLPVWVICNFNYLSSIYY